MTHDLDGEVVPLWATVKLFSNIPEVTGRNKKKRGKNYSNKFTVADAIMLYAVRTLQLGQYWTDVNPAGVYADENSIEKTNI